MLGIKNGRQPQLDNTASGIRRAEMVMSPDFLGCRATPCERGYMRIYSAPVLAEVTHIKHVLEMHDIACYIQGEYRSGAAGELPPTETWPELWVVDLSNVEEAKRLGAEALVLPSSTVTQAARSSFRPGALGARLGTTHAIASMRTDKDSG